MTKTCPCGKRRKLPNKPACPKCWRAYLENDNLAALEREHRRHVAVAKNTQPPLHSPYAKKWRFPQGWGGS